MSKFRFAIVVITITSFFFACGALTQDPERPEVAILGGLICAALPLIGFAVGWLAWRRNWTLGIDPDDS